MPETIHAKTVFDEHSQLGAFRLHMWHRYRFWLMLRTFLSVAILLAGIIMLLSQGPHPMGILMLMVGTFALLRPLVWKMMHARKLRQLPGYGHAVVYSFTPDHIKIHGEDRGAEVSWVDIFEAVPTRRGLLLYHGKKSYTWVPCESFDSIQDFDQVSEWAKTR